MSEIGGRRRRHGFLASSTGVTGAAALALTPALPAAAAATARTPNANCSPCAATELTERQRARPSIAPRPKIVTRRGWGADESLRSGGFVHTKKDKAVFVHHTATGNNYTCSQAPSVIRGICHYHVLSMGRRDIGHNSLVDTCGTLYERRAGGVAKPVLGAHTMGFNSNSVGIAVIGTYSRSDPSSAAVRAVARLVAWKLGLCGMNPRGKTYLKSAGGNLYQKGKNVRLNAVSGHRDGSPPTAPKQSCTESSAASAEPRRATGTAEAGPHRTSLEGGRERPAYTGRPNDRSAGPGRKQRRQVTEAILLVGGKGTRLRPLTVHTPKPMVRAAGVPFLTHQLARARAAGVEHIVLATSYLAEVFEPYFGDGSSLGLHLEYVTEEEPLGTGGAIRNVASRLRSGPEEPVLIFNGDILTGLDIPALVRTHEETGADVSLHLTRVTDPRAYGLVPTDETGRVLAFLEKPQTPEEIVTDQINAGVYVFRRSVIDTIPRGRPVSVERETFPDLLSAGAHLQGTVDSTYWLDLGTPAAFVRGSADLVLGRAPSPAVPGRCGDRLVLPTAVVAPDAKLTAGTVVGEGALVAEGARVSGSTILPGAVIEPGAVITDSLIGTRARIGTRSVLTGTVIGDGAIVGPDNELRDGVRIWCDARIPAGAVRFSSDQ